VVTTAITRGDLTQRTEIQVKGEMSMLKGTKTLFQICMAPFINVSFLV
jgi:hypothetical protein